MLAEEGTIETLNVLKIEYEGVINAIFESYHLNMTSDAERIICEIDRKAMQLKARLLDEEISKLLS